MAKVSRTDLIFLMLYAPDRPGAKPAQELKGITRLEKLLFLWQQEGPIRKISEDEYEFEPHNFGPFSKDIYDDVALLTNAGFIEERIQLWGASTDYVEARDVIGADEGSEPHEKIYRLTDKGKAVAEQLHKDIPPQASKELVAIKQRYVRLSLTQLIRYVYRKYPDLTHKSKLKHLQPSR